MTFGQKVKMLRKTKQLTQQQLADLCGYADKSAISKIELGGEVPFNKIQPLANALGVSVAELTEKETARILNSSVAYGDFQLLSRYNLLNQSNKEAVCTLIESLINGQEISN